MKYSSRRNKMLGQNAQRKVDLNTEKVRLQDMLLLPRRGITPAIKAARVRWREENPDVYPAPWEKFSMG